MIYINDKINNKINLLNNDNLYVVADFDGTITEKGSYNSWGILEKSNFICKEYTKKSLELLNYYRPIEFNPKVDSITKNKLMIEWWSKNISLFIEYGLKEEAVNNAISNISVMNFRDGGKEFLKKMYQKNIPVIIISAGIGNFIEQFLHHNQCLFSNIHIISNFIKFEDGVAVGIEDNIIHSQNKNIVSLNQNIISYIKNRDKILLLGDNFADIKMVTEEKKDDTIRIGFLDTNIDENLDVFRKEFDIVATDNTSFNDLLKILNNI